MAMRKGQRYRATISLGWLQSAASTETVAGKFREAGFEGTGRRRTAGRFGQRRMPAPRFRTKSQTSKSRFDGET